VDDILRYAMYFENYGREREARARYAALPAAQAATRCVNCPAPCQAGCPFELPIRQKLLRAHRTLQA
jgi:predicted aldo/keto reductase-like oxidoreductase